MLKEDKIQEILKLVRIKLEDTPSENIFKENKDIEKTAYSIGNVSGRAEAMGAFIDVLYNLDSLN